MLPFFPNQHIVGQALPGPNNAPDKAAAEAVPGAQPFPQALPSLPAGALRAGHSKPPSQLKNSDSNLGVRSMQHKYCLFLLFCFFFLFFILTCDRVFAIKFTASQEHP